jgi:uncharacterized caspase-like protein
VQPKRILSLGAAAVFALIGLSARAQQPNSPNLFNSYESAMARAVEQCRTLWGNPIFDPLRDKVPLGPQKPTMEMLTSSARLEAKDQPVARTAITVVQQCRMAYAPAYAMLPGSAQTLIEGLYREEDALIAQLYTGKITFGEFNVGENKLAGKIFRAFSVDPMMDASPRNDARTPAALPRDVRMALVIGNGKYANLPKLSNPTNDAEAMADVLGKMGYATRLLLNASEQDLRREVRKFAGESSRADVALVFYAGHGAQLNGENYLLPTDIDIPQTEADIQLSGLKVDDLINSIRSNTKIVFLDACRDNPALFKNLAKGRGGRAAGLAPATGANLDPGKPGGGIFIAYATDSGSIALDGLGKHSPFTQALLRYMQEPMSIDDMFSLVNKEVRLVTNYTQRPYKYASLEAIFCVFGPCPGSRTPPPGPVNAIQQAKASEAEELQIALRSNSIDALKSYLEKYPETSKRPELIATISRMRRTEFTEWTLYGSNERGFPQFIKISSIRQIGDKVSVETRYVIDPVVSGNKFPAGSYREDLMVTHCTKPITAMAESRVIDPKGKPLYAYKWADPQYLDLAIGGSFTPGSIAALTQKIVCNEGLRTPLLRKQELAAMKFSSLSSTISGDGDVFYAFAQNEVSAVGSKEIKLIVRLHNDVEVSLSKRPVSDVPSYRTQVSHLSLDCTNDTMGLAKTEYYDANHDLVYFDTSGSEVKEIPNNSPVGLLRRIVCNANEVGK